MLLTAQECADYIGPACPECRTERPIVLEWIEATTDRTGPLYEPSLIACRNEVCPRSAP